MAKHEGEGSFAFDPETAAFRTRLVGNLKIDARSAESKDLLETWAIRGEMLVEKGALSTFDWNWDEAEVYLEAEQHEAAVHVLKGALYEAIHQQNERQTRRFSAKLLELGEDPTDFSEFED